jgi:hypothetical protein
MSYEAEERLFRYQSSPELVHKEVDLCIGWSRFLHRISAWNEGWAHNVDYFMTIGSSYNYTFESDESECRSEQGYARPAWLMPRHDVSYVPGDTFEHFLNDLLESRTFFCGPSVWAGSDAERSWREAELCKLREEIAKRGRNPQSVLDVVQKAWEHLNKSPTCDQAAKALEIIRHAVREKFLERVEGLKSWQERKREQTKNARALTTTQKKALQKIDAAIAAVRAFYDATQAVEACRPEGQPFWVTNCLTHREAKKVYATSSKVIKIQFDLIRIENELKSVSLPPSQIKGLGKRGRQEKKALNAAFKGLKAMFTSHPARNSPRKAGEYATAILYVAGLVSRYDPEAMANKFYQRQWSRRRKKASL